MGSTASVDKKYREPEVSETVRLMETDESLRNSFITFLSNSSGIENSPLFANLEDYSSTYRAELAQKFESYLDEFSQPKEANPEGSGCIDYMQKNATESRQTLTLPKSDENMAASLLKADNAVLILIFLGGYDNFLKSSIFREWFWTRRAPALQSNNLLSRSVTNFKIDNLSRLLTPAEWRSTLFTALQDLPFSVSVADATADGFPLLFVNSKFEAMSGSFSAEAVGKSNKFLQGGIVESDMRGVMTATLGTKRPCRVFLTNKRKDGTVFRNLLSMKPICNLKGEYRYVIGMQLDVSVPETTALTLVAASDLFRALPTVTSEL